MNEKNQLGFIHQFIPSDNKKDNRSKTLLLLHGTGGDENDLISIAKMLAHQNISILSPRGKVLENGMPRFFRRLAEGVFDIEDLKFRTNELADFVQNASKVYAFDARLALAIGFSNGANIAASMLLLRPEVLAGAILFRPMVPIVPDTLPYLSSRHILISAGLHDPIVPKQETNNLFDLLKQAGANVSLQWQNSGHEITPRDIRAARDWLSTFLVSK
jgi:phospholipase/carboxylesterase/glyoxalase family protein